MTPQATRGVFGGKYFKRAKKQQQSRIVFDVILDVHTHVDNRERARASD